MHAFLDGWPRLLHWALLELWLDALAHGRASLHWRWPTR